MILYYIIPTCYIILQNIILYIILNCIILGFRICGGGRTGESLCHFKRQPYPPPEYNSAHDHCMQYIQVRGGLSDLSTLVVVTVTEAVAKLRERMRMKMRVVHTSSLIMECKYIAA